MFAYNSEPGPEGTPVQSTLRAAAELLQRTRTHNGKSQPLAYRGVHRSYWQ